MLLSRLLVLLGAVIFMVGCGASGRTESSTGNGGGSQAASSDLSTPEGAILALEEAYRAKDIEAAVRCKDFEVEAKMMLQKINADFGDDAEILAKTAEVLELGFRAEMKESGFPDFHDVVSSFPMKVPYEGRDDVVQVTEQCRLGDGTTITNTLVVANTANGWKVVSVPD